MSGRNALKRWITPVILLAVVGAVFVLASVINTRLQTRPISSTDEATTIPEFILENQDGDSVDLYDFHGDVWVADFVSSRCDGNCGALTQQMAALAKEAQSDPSIKDVRFVSFSSDPDNDPPELLSRFGPAHGLDGARWTFLTGTRQAVRNVVRSGFRLSMNDDRANAPIVTTDNFVVVDREGRMRGSYPVLTEAGRKGIRDSLKKITAEPRPFDVFVPPDAGHPDWLAGMQDSQLKSAASVSVPHDFSFADRTGASGIAFRVDHSQDIGKYYRATHYDHGTAIAVADVDGDGLPDVYFVNQVGRNALYRNLGRGHFEDVTDRAGVAVGDRACVGASFGDIDNDGAPDLFVSCVREGNILFHNDGHGRFANITDQAGVRGTGGHSSGAVFFDYDGDGLLDLFVTNVGKYTQDKKRDDGLWQSFSDAFAGHLHPDRFETSILYHNAGSNRFEDVTKASGLMHAAWSGDVTPFDYEESGHPSLYVPSMQGHDEFWYNLGNGHFENRSRRLFPATPWGSMGVKVFDWNGDGRLDLFVTDMHTDMSSPLLPDNEKKKHDPMTFFPPRFLGTDGHHILGNALFTNMGEKFQETSDAANVETGWPWGPSVGDLNADGWPDVFVSAGMDYPFRYRGDDVLLNEKGKRFANAEYILGVEPRRRIVRPWFTVDCDGADVQTDICQGEIEPVLTTDTRTPEERKKGAARHGRVTVWAVRASRSAAIFDMDGDGDLDILSNQYGDVPRVLISDLAQRTQVHYVTVKLVGRRSNRDGFGAIVTLEAGGHAQVQVNDGKSGYLGQSVIPLYFGLGSAAQAGLIKVKWPSGKEQTVRGPIASGRGLVIEETN